MQIKNEQQPKFWQRIDFWSDSQMSYRDIWEFQKKRLDEIARDEAPETLIFCEHEDVLTVGKRAHLENLLKTDLPLYHIERGGDVTWHGPGQLVVYPLFRLQGHFFQKGLHEFLRFWEQVLIELINAQGLDAGRYGPTGVWIKREDQSVKKIASIGIAVRKWITYHGISINISNSKEGFSKIRPCNFNSDIMTSLQDEGVFIPVKDFSHLLERQMRLALGLDSAAPGEFKPEILGGGTELFKSSASFR